MRGVCIHHALWWLLFIVCVRDDAQLPDSDTGRSISFFYDSRGWTDSAPLVSFAGVLEDSGETLPSSKHANSLLQLADISTGSCSAVAIVCGVLLVTYPTDWVGSGVQRFYMVKPCPKEMKCDVEVLTSTSPCESKHLHRVFVSYT